MASAFNDEPVDRCIAALHALKLVWRCYGAGPPGKKHVDDILDLLVMGEKSPKSLPSMMSATLRSFGTVHQDTDQVP
jgi:hypothetical protein